MSKISNAFKNGKAFIAFLTAGDPSLEKTEEFVLEMVKAGADLIEIGIPFSDPIAEGEVIQRANLRALSTGTTMDKVFDTVKRIRQKTQVPLVFLTYLNPVFTYGYDHFFRECSEHGVDGVIIPDIPFEEKGELMPFSDKYNVDIISLIAPTSEERISKIASASKGFVYCVSSKGVTGVRNEIKTDLQSIVSSVRSATKVPVAVGFGISTPQQASEIVKYADGIIVGSAIVKIIEQNGNNAAAPLYDYVLNMKKYII
ncbi:tryptophan synthase subunit alpha [Ruminiclostridium cellulolyticum]|uniref:Tryptophan synthase alpha chain n=1 Tax=Ruminiclostridium cellulolyticum (strain ATCC 35319 / DSM 5812 / JCM 6584 / H10) TaxID=394503 RepID=B8I0V3_RUMCH|nr:tryptophan synthase subunit alpha [Ruminiclostridium cellulolyticum]ACL77509.1 tryptophan synthase, alpha subunit [Ruminiclostridium cellulolyticum H10]